jgi:hypothetical protein
MDDVEKRKFLTTPGLNSNASVFQPLVSPYTDYANPAPTLEIVSESITHETGEA